jgi:hypothetical protein
MSRITAWALLALYLLAVGVYPAAVAPVAAVATGAAAVIAVIPAPALLLLAFIAWYRRKPTPAQAKTA